MDNIQFVSVLNLQTQEYKEEIVNIDNNKKTITLGRSY